MDLLYAFIDQLAAGMSDEKGASERGRGSRLMVRGRGEKAPPGRMRRAVS